MTVNEQQRSQEQARYTSLQTKFLLGLAAILIFFSALASTTIYYFQKKSLEDEAYQKTELVMTAMAANRSYVREVLRPKMYDKLGQDVFLLEAMSSSYISRNVMERFNEDLYDFIYRRVAKNSRNPNYEADEREVEMIQYFAENPAIEEWQGIIEKEDHRYFMRYRPVYSEPSCSHCHGNPENAPKEIIELYGDERGFYREVGNVYGVISVGLPVDLNLQKIKEIAITVFAGVLPSILFLYAIISIFFNKVIAQNLNNLLNIFRTSLQDEKRVQTYTKSDPVDEISELTDVAQRMAKDLQENREQLESYAAKILQSKELLQSVFDGITDPVVLIDTKGKIKNVNKAFLNRYSITLDQVLEHSITTLPFTGLCPLIECGDILISLPDAPISRQMNMENGEIFLIYFYPIHDEQGKTDSIVCYVKDITEQKRLEQKIQQTEKIVSMGQLAAGVAHEINNPLGIILCHIDLIKDDSSLSEEARADLTTIEKHAGNCRTIIADLLNFARQHKSIKELSSINSIIQDVVQIAANQFQQQNITVDLELDKTMVMINVDVDKMKQVFFNLLLNSAHAIDEDGYILLTTRYDKVNQLVTLTVDDNGCGVPPETADKIFDPFFTTKDPGKGTGLGLSVSYGIIEDHNGEISMESVPGKGSRFTITLPTHEDTNG
jgi:two-component system NtrC family sensor kinase